MTEPHDPPLIDTREGLAELLAHLRSAGRFAFDTEFVSESTFEPILGLVQVATRERIAAIDPIAIGDVSAMWDVVNDPAVEVVMHAAGEDLRIGKIQSGRLPDRVVDTQVAAGLVGFSYPLSLGNLIQQTLGVSVSGGETRTDWRKRPLTPAQLRYALDDVRYLLDAADRIGKRLDRLERRAWAEVEYRALLETVRARDDEDRWRRLPGLNSLNRRGLEAARRLSIWRREDARKANRPLRGILKDDLLVAIAKRMPATVADLRALRDFNRSELIARANDIVRVLAEAREVPNEELPEPGERRDDGPGGSMVVSLLNAAMAQCAAGAEVATSLLGTTADLKELVRWHVAGRPAARPPAILEGWRGEVCGRTLLDVVAGRRSLRIVDPEAEVPVALDPVASEGDARA